MESKALTSVLWKADAEMHLVHFLLEEILFVEKEDDGGGGEVLVVTDAVEQVKAFVHPVLWDRKGEHMQHE